MNSFSLFEGFSEVILEVAWALAPLIGVFCIFQVLFLKYPKKKIVQILKGMILAFLGLTLFLQGVKTGFLPAGELMGEHIGKSENNWIIVPVGFIIGFVVTLAEPAVRVLTYEVEKVSGGYIPQRILLATLAFGVAGSVSLAMARILLGIPLWYLVLPGYIIALSLVPFTHKQFVAIAFDSGGVATGPMTVTFVLTLALGVANVIEGRDPILDGFGLIALVALTPILTVLVLGLLYERKEKEIERNRLQSALQTNSGDHQEGNG